MKLEDIGFYTLSNVRAKQATAHSPLWRCELLLTDKCNFKCPYCRRLREDCQGTVPQKTANSIIDYWGGQNLQNIRFSGGEPTTYEGLKDLVQRAKSFKMEHIALSTNGSADLSYYKDLADAGVNDFSISLDACCSAFGLKMTGGVLGAWEKVVENIRELSKLTYVTVGMVFNEENVKQAREAIEFAHGLGVADIRIISSAQYNGAIERIATLDRSILNAHPILNYRVKRSLKGLKVRGMCESDSPRCSLVLDDMAVAGDYHFPCIIYLREGGDPIGKISDAGVRHQRAEWRNNHNTLCDPICRQNCLDVCIKYNNTHEELRDD